MLVCLLLLGVLGLFNQFPGKVPSGLQPLDPSMCVCLVQLFYSRLICRLGVLPVKEDLGDNTTIQ